MIKENIGRYFGPYTDENRALASIEEMINTSCVLHPFRPKPTRNSF